MEQMTAEDVEKRAREANVWGDLVEISASEWEDGWRVDIRCDTDSMVGIVQGSHENVLEPDPDFKRFCDDLPFAVWNVMFHDDMLTLRGTKRLPR